MTANIRDEKYLNRRQFLGASAAALSAVAGTAGCGGGGAGGGGGGGGTGVTLTPAQQLATLNASLAFAGTLNHQNLAADSSAMQQFLKTQAMVDVTTITSDGTVVAHLVDGNIFAFINNRIPSVAAALSKSRAVELPAQINANLFNLFADILDSATPIGAMLGANGYSGSIARTIAVEDLRGINNLTGVFYLNTHGALIPTTVGTSPGTPANKPTQFLPQPLSYGMATNTAITLASLTAYSAEWIAGRLVPFVIPLPVTQNGSTTLVDVMTWAITDKFVQQYMSFAANSFVFVNACTSYNPQIRAACFAKNASVYTGWTATVLTTQASAAAQAAFDILLGTNKVFTGNPLIRPFDWNAAYGYLSMKGLANPDPTGTGTRLISTANPNAGKGNFGLLAPNILYLVLDASTNTLRIYGEFGSTAGSVTIDGGPIGGSVSWSDSVITISGFPRSGPGSAGEIEVWVGAAKSNGRFLTAWDGQLEVKAPAIGGVVGPYWKGTWKFRVRGDLYGYRNSPAFPWSYNGPGTSSGAHIISQSFPWYATSDCTVSLEAGGTGTESQTNTVYSVTLAPGVNPTYAVVRPYGYSPPNSYGFYAGGEFIGGSNAAAGGIATGIVLAPVIYVPNALHIMQTISGRPGPPFNLDIGGTAWLGPQQIPIVLGDGLNITSGSVTQAATTATWTAGTVEGSPTISGARSALRLTPR